MQLSPAAAMDVLFFTDSKTVAAWLIGQMAVDKNETIEVISAIDVKEVHEDNDDNNDNESYDDDFD